MVASFPGMHLITLFILFIKSCYFGIVCENKNAQEHWIDLLQCVLPLCPSSNMIKDTCSCLLFPYIWRWSNSSMLYKRMKWMYTLFAPDFQACNNKILYIYQQKKCANFHFKHHCSFCSPHHCKCYMLYKKSYI